MKKIKLIAITCLICSLGACKKWKEPTDVNFYVDIEKTATLNGQLVFTGGHITLDYFDFDGDREKGDDVLFNKNFEQGLIIPFDETQVVTELEFVIPQGEYKRLDIGFKTFDNNGDVCVLVEGSYTYNGGGVIPFRFEFVDTEQFKVRAENNNGGNIVLDKDIQSPAKIILNPNHWFQPVPISLFESAIITNLSGTNTIVINKTVNSVIYDIVLGRLDESSLIVFNY